jgi:hypothetical protein
MIYKYPIESKITEKELKENFTFKNYYNEKRK